MNLNKKLLKAVSIMLALLMMGGVVAYAAKETDETKQANKTETVIGESTQNTAAQPGSAGEAPYTKTETVYVNLDSSGKPTRKTVTDWLHSDTPNAVLKDKTTLKEIENVKGDQQPVQDGSDVTWQMQGSDLYYRGKSEKDLPVDISIQYTLDGKEMTAEEMAGKSGHMQMQISVKNNLKQKIELNGKKVEMYTPVMAAFAVSFPDDTFQNVSVSDGTVQSDGNNHAAAFVAIPGMDESLGLSGYDLPGMENLTFPSEFTVTADVNEFSMGPIGVLVSNEIPELDDLDADEDIDSMVADLNSLKEAQNNLDLWDADGEIRSMFQNPELTGNAQVLVDDIFKFYDMDTAIMDILPRYITKENIDLYDRVEKDLDDVDLDKLLNSESVENLVNRLTRSNIAKIRLLLKDYDKLQDLDSEKLEDLLEETLDLMDRLDKNEEEIHTIEVLASYATQMMQMMDILNDPQFEQMMDPATLKAAFTAIAKTQVEAEVQKQTGTTPSRLLAAESTMLNGGDISAYKNDILAAFAVAKASGKIDEKQYQQLVALLENYDSMKDQFIPSDLPEIPQLPNIPGMNGQTGTTQQPIIPPTESEPDKDSETSAPSEQKPETEEEKPQTDSGEGEKEEGSTNPDTEGEGEKDQNTDSSEQPEIDETDETTSGGEENDGEQMGYGTSDSLNQEESAGSYSELDEQLEQLTDSELPEENLDEQMQVQPEQQPDTQMPEEDLDVQMQLQAEEMVPGMSNQVAEQSIYSTNLQELIEKLIKEFLTNLKGKSGCQQILEVADPVRVALQEKVDTASEQAADEILTQKVNPVLNDVKQLKQNIVTDLGGDADKAKEKLDRAKAFAEEMIDALQDLIEQADNLEKGKDAEDLLEEARDMIDHLEENKGNIQALEDFLNEWSDKDLEKLRKNYPTLKKDYQEIKPILDDLQKDLEDPEVDASLHNSPETVDDLMQIKDDIMDNREISEIMKKTVDPDSVDHANQMFNIFDDLQAKGSIDKYTGQADDLQELTDRIDAYVDLADSYRIYSDAAEDADTSVTFIMKTDEVDKPEKPQPPEAPVEEENGFIAWCKDIWHKIFGND